MVVLRPVFIDPVVGFMGASVAAANFELFPQFCSNGIFVEKLVPEFLRAICILQLMIEGHAVARIALVKYPAPDKHLPSTHFGLTPKDASATDEFMHPQYGCVACAGSPHQSMTAESHPLSVAQKSRHLGSSSPAFVAQNARTAPVEASFCL